MYKTILVHVDETPHAIARIDAAIALALQHQAHLIGSALTGLSAYLFPSSVLEPQLPAMAIPIEHFRAEADRALDLFAARARKAGVASFERRRIDDDAGNGLALQARYADLVVISQIAPDAFLPRLRSDFPEFVLLHSARPVLVLPTSAGPAGMGAPGKRVTVAWNGSSNAVRAISSAIPMLQHAEQVRVVALQPDPQLRAEEPGADLGLYLARHGIAVVAESSACGPDTGAALLAYAAGHQSDLIVMGAFGHSRFSEIMLGGASRTALRSSPIALWMAH